MRPVECLFAAALGAAVAIGAGCSKALPPTVPLASSPSSPVAIVPIPEEWGVKPLEHEASLLPDTPPIRFTKIFTLRQEASAGCPSYMEFSPDGKTLAALGIGDGAGHNGVALWDVQKRTMLRGLTDVAKKPGLAAIAFVPPGDRLVAGRWQANAVIVWDVQSGKILDTLDAEWQGGLGVTGLAAFPDGNAVVCCIEPEGMIWDLRAKTHQPLAPHDMRRFQSVAFTADGSRFATSVDEHTRPTAIVIWDAKTRCATSEIPVGSNSHHFAIAPDGRTLAASYDDSTLVHGPRLAPTVVGVWDVPSGNKIMAGRLFNWEVIDLTYTRDSKYLLATGCQRNGIEDGGMPEIGVWELATGKLVAKLPGNFRNDAHLAISPDNRLLAVPGPEITIYSIEYAAPPKPKGP
jgi:WD40 repeat protein